MNVIETLEKEEADRLLSLRKIPEFQPGDTVRVNVKIKEGERERVQALELWIENRFAIEVLTPRMQADYAAALAPETRRAA